MSTCLELQTRAAELAALWGLGNTAVAPDWKALVNQAYKEFCWETEAIHGPEATFSTIANQAEYTLPGNEWKHVSVAAYDKSPLERLNEQVVRRNDLTWFIREAATPHGFWIPRFNTIRLHPKPSADNVTVTVYGIRLPDDLDDSDVPLLPIVYHEALAIRAYYLQAKKFAKGEARATLAANTVEYEEFVQRFKQEQSENQGMDMNRYITPIEPDRVYA